MGITLFKIRSSRVTTIVAATALVAIGSAGGAVAGSLITGSQIASGTITQRNLASNSVGWRQLIDGQVTTSKLYPAVAAELAKAAAPVATRTLGNASGAPVTIANIGGSFATGSSAPYTVRATDVAPATTMHLSAGTYLISSHAQYERVNPSASGTGNPVLELAVRGQDGTKFGQNFGTCFTGAFPNGPGNVDQTCSDSQLITVPAGGIDLKIYAFGYNSDQSATGSGDYQVWANVAVLPIK